MALVEKQNLIQCDGSAAVNAGPALGTPAPPCLMPSPDERPPAQQEAGAGAAPWRGRGIVGVLRQRTECGWLNPALQNALDKFTRRHRQARDGQIDPVFGRDTEIRQMVDILSRRRKTTQSSSVSRAWARPLWWKARALRIAEGNVPDAPASVGAHPLTSVCCRPAPGSKASSSSGRKISLRRYSSRLRQGVAVYRRGAHDHRRVIRRAAGCRQPLLKPALARGELRTDLPPPPRPEYKQYLERDAAPERRFQMVKVDELDDDTACLMPGLKSRYADHHGVHIIDDGKRAAVTLSRRYLTGRQLPDKAVDLLGHRFRPPAYEFGYRAWSRWTRMKAQLTVLVRRSRRCWKILRWATAPAAIGWRPLSRRRTALFWRWIPLKLSMAVERSHAKRCSPVAAISPARRKLAIYKPRLSPSSRAIRWLGLDVDVRTVATVIADWTGVPLSLSKDEQIELLSLEESLGKRVAGPRRP